MWIRTCEVALNNTVWSIVLEHGRKVTSVDMTCIAFC
jgi:hypothetical protein